jgi:hypothetical protein
LSEEFVSLFEQVLNEILDFSLENYEFYKYSYLAVASAVVACSRKLIGLKSVWPLLMEQYTDMTWEELSECASLLLSAYLKSENSLY